MLASDATGTGGDRVAVAATPVDLEHELAAGRLDELEDVVAGLGDHVARLDEDDVVAGTEARALRRAGRVDALDAGRSAPGQGEAPWHLEAENVWSVEYFYSFFFVGF